MLEQIKINDKFIPLFEQPEGVRYYIVTGGRGGTKSFTVSSWSNLKTFEENAKILYTRYTLKSAEKSIIPEFEEKIKLLNAEEHFKVNKTDITNIKTGSQILFSGIKTSAGNQTANLKSLQGVSVWVLDEAEELLDEAEFDKIDLSIRTVNSNNIVILILNPVTKEHFIHKKFFEEMGVQGGFNGIKGDVCYIHTTYLDNIENLSESYLKRIEKIKINNPEKYEHVILGGWRNKAEGVIIDNWKYGKFDESIGFNYGLDFGYTTDPDACAKVAIDEKNKKIYVKEMFYRNGQTIDVITKKVAELPKGNIVADSASQRLIEHLRNYSGKSILEVKKPPGSILQGIRLMQNYEVIVEEGSTNIVKEFNNYCWNGKAKEAPIDMYNHLIDAIRYVVYTYSSRQFKKEQQYENENTRLAKGIGVGSTNTQW